MQRARGHSVGTGSIGERLGHRELSVETREDAFIARLATLVRQATPAGEGRDACSHLVGGSINTFKAKSEEQRSGSG